MCIEGPIGVESAVVLTYSINFEAEMKKLIVLSMILVYGLTSTGAIVHLDYCCGKLANISLSPFQEDECNQKAVKAKGCCDSKQVHLKVKGEQEAAFKWVNEQKQSASPVALASDVYELVSVYRPVNEFSTGPPILTSPLPLFIQHSHFRI